MGTAVPANKIGGLIPALFLHRRKENMSNVDKEKIVLYTVNDIQQIFKLGRTKAYELMSANGFPSFRLNTKLYVESGKLQAWIDKRAGKSFDF